MYIGVKYALRAELFAAILTFEHAHLVGWSKLWLECDSTLVLDAFKISNLVPYDLNRR